MKKNNITKRITAILAVITLLAVMMAGCSKKETNAVPKDDGKGTESVTGGVKDHAAGTAGGELTNGDSDISTDKEAPTAGDSEEYFRFEARTESELSKEAGASSSDIRTEAASDVLLSESIPMAIFESKAGGADTYGADGSVIRDGWDYGEGDYPEEGIFPEDGWDMDESGDDYSDIFEEPPYIRPAAGLLTAGEWNDNLHFDFLKNLLNNGQQADYSSFFKDWGLTPFSRLAVHVSTGETTVVSGSAIGALNVENAYVTVYSSEGSTIWQSRTDNKGMTYAFYRLNGGDAVPAKVSVTSGSFTIEKEVASGDLLDGNTLEIVLDGSASAAKKLDLMFVVDTTGSMGDEIAYLQKELEDVIKRVEHDNANLPVRLSVNFYRDLEDEYIVRSNPFSSDISSQLIRLNAESADGGGDYEEAVELALEDAVNAHDWDSDSVKLMFIVLDAPPHNTDEIRAQLASTITDAVKKGIRIIPIASSGVDKSTEFLLRTFAMTTGGTYTFLTDDSGIGGSHIEPTIGSYEVENLNDLLVRIIGEYL